jgi:hypothetical protein
MNKWLILFFLLSPSVVRAQVVTPNFTQGSMNATTTSTQVINETVTVNKYGGDYSSWTGENVHIDTGSQGIAGGITVNNQIFEIHNAGDAFQLEMVTRAKTDLIENVVEVRDITTNSTTTSLSVFSQ